MEIIAVIAFYAVVFAVIVFLRYAARADVKHWHGGPR
jgi:hypothetical protein